MNRLYDLIIRYSASMLSPIMALSVFTLSIFALVFETHLSQVAEEDIGLNILLVIIYSAIAVSIASVFISLNEGGKSYTDNIDLIKLEILGYRRANTIFAIGISMWALVWLVNPSFSRVEAFFTIFTLLSGVTLYSLNKKSARLSEIMASKEERYTQKSNVIN